MIKAGFKVVDPGRFDLPANNFLARNRRLQDERCGAHLRRHSRPRLHRLLQNPGGPAGLQAEMHRRGQGRRVPAGRLSPMGDRAINFLTNEVWWWARYPPLSSGLSKQSSAELASPIEKEANQQAVDRPGLPPFLARGRDRHLDADPEARRSRLDPRRAARYQLDQSVVGPINFKTGPLPNCSERDQDAQRPVAQGQEVAARAGARRQHERGRTSRFRASPCR